MRAQLVDEDEVLFGDGGTEAVLVRLSVIDRHKILHTIQSAGIAGSLGVSRAFEHQPGATSEPDGICLSMLDAPEIQLSGCFDGLGHVSITWLVLGAIDELTADSCRFV